MYLKCTSLGKKLWSNKMILTCPEHFSRQSSYDVCTSKETFLLLLLFFHFNCYLVKNSKTFKPWSTNQTFLVFTLKIFFLFKYRNLENLCRCDATTRPKKKEIRSMKMRTFFFLCEFFFCAISSF